MSIAKDGTKLVIRGYTQETSDVIKCGFTEVVLQRKSQRIQMVNYKIYYDLYADSNYYSLSKSLTVTLGYPTHYEKKSLFSTQKVEVATGYLSFQIKRRH